mmetsp:Transcript_4214/g.6366  ORF Transcript_4214/g.6366 Transcript_4214/m.6366 type:complete len:112 (-) Transcript_4214:242-577(-)
MFPHLKECSKQGRIEDTPNGYPGTVKKYRNQAYPEGQKGWQINDPGRKSLLVKDPAGNEEPRVDFDAHAGTHAPPCFRPGERNDKVNEGRHVVLNNRARTLDTTRNEGHPE